MTNEKGIVPSDTYDESEPDSDEVGQHYHDKLPELPNIETVARITQAFNSDGTIRKHIKATKTDFVHNLIYLDGKKFDFVGREYLFPLYNRRDSDILLKTARQVEKCAVVSTLCDMADGTRKRIDAIVPGDRVMALSSDQEHCFEPNTVIASETNGNRPCLRFVTEGGSRLEVTRNHPLMTDSGFLVAEAITLGHKLMGVPRQFASDFSEANYYADDPIISIEDIGEQPTWGIQTTSGTYISEFVINHNTTFLANNLVVSSVVQPYNKSLYVSPSHTQTRQFSNEKLRPAIEKSPFVKRYFQDHAVSTQVFEKGFTNGSYVFLRSAFRSADRTRGISARNLCLDEIQDMLGSEIPVIMECTSHFPDANRMMAGTPKSLDNPIETYWQETTQNEWLVPCGCGKWNFLDETNIAPTEMYTSGKLPPGPVCKKCMRPLNIRSGRWMTTCQGKLIQGYRIPQLMVPWIVGLYDQWLRILWKRDNYPMGQLYNEVLGLSYDSASKPITRDQLIELCSSYDLWNPENLTPAILQESHSMMLTAGVDWGEGNDGSEKSPSGKIRNASYTILTIGAYIDQKTWAVKLVKKYEGREVDPDHVVKDIARICRALNVQLVGVDWGHGWGVNNHLTRLMAPQANPRITDAYGKHKVVQFQYLPKLKQRMKWDPLGFRYHLSRNFMMSELFFDMKHGFIQFPRWAQIERYAKDILAIYAEYVEFRREMKYDHRSTDPDDWFHSLHYAKLASDILTGKSRRYTLDIPQE